MATSSVNTHLHELNEKTVLSLLGNVKASVNWYGGRKITVLKEGKESEDAKDSFTFTELYDAIGSNDLATIEVMEVLDHLDDLTRKTNRFQDFAIFFRSLPGKISFLFKKYCCCLFPLNFGISNNAEMSKTLLWDAAIEKRVSKACGSKKIEENQKQASDQNISPSTFFIQLFYGDNDGVTKELIPTNAKIAEVFREVYHFGNSEFSELLALTDEDCKKLRVGTILDLAKEPAVQTESHLRVDGRIFHQFGKLILTLSSNKKYLSEHNSNSEIFEAKKISLAKKYFEKAIQHHDDEANKSLEALEKPKNQIVLSID